LVGLINKAQSECLNQSDDHTWEHCLNSAGSIYLESDVDEQLLLHITFQQAIKLHSIIIQGPTGLYFVIFFSLTCLFILIDFNYQDNGPKDVKLFINQTRTLDFDSAENFQPIQALELKPEDLTNNSVIKLRYVKFQNVQNLTVIFNFIYRLF
jgi:hypothetical protein